jgi:hypothetical protein
MLWFVFTAIMVYYIKNGWYYLAILPGMNSLAWATFGFKFLDEEV